MVAYTKDRVGKESLEQRRRQARNLMERTCHTDDIRNIQQLIVRQSRIFNVGPHICNYLMGEHFLIMLTLTIGEKATSAAIRELYEPRRHVTEEEIYRAFLKHTPPEIEREFRALYKRLHGGEYDEEG